MERVRFNGEGVPFYKGTAQKVYPCLLRRDRDDQDEIVTLNIQGNNIKRMCSFLALEWFVRNYRRLTIGQQDALVDFLWLSGRLYHQDYCCLKTV